MTVSKDKTKGLIRKTNYFYFQNLPGLEDAVVEEVLKGFTVDVVVPVMSLI